MITKLILLISFLAVIPTAVDASPIAVLNKTLALYTENELDGLPIRACPLNNVSFPVNNSSVMFDLPSPDLSLKYVALGRGTQNYTCSNANSTDAPSAIGAVATLFDASCLAAFLPDILNDIPPVLLQVPRDAAVAAAMALDQLTSAENGSFVLAQHYFVDKTTPLFDFRPYGHPDWMEAEIWQSAAAPPDSIPGSVPWLKLGYKAGSGIYVSDSRITVVPKLLVY